LQKHLLILGLIVATLLFRLPILLNARDVNSDAALVGLQAMHMLRGEWSWLLWGVGYQSSLDSILTAGAFALFGASPGVLMAVPTVLHGVVTALAFLVLRRRLDPWLAIVCTLPLVFAPVALTWPIVSANRQACIVLYFLSIWLLDGAAASKRPALLYGLGALCAGTLLVVDLFAVLMLPGLVALLAMCLFDEPHDRVHLKQRITSALAGCAVSAALFVMSHSDRQATSGQAGLTLARASSNASLLWDTCLPYSLGSLRYHETSVRYRGSLSPAPMPSRVLYTAAGWSLVLGILTSGVLALSKVSWPLRRLGMFGLITTVLTLAAFVFSVMPADLWSVRYLGPIFWAVPFALAPLAHWLGQRTFTLAILPWLIVGGISGWRSYQSPFTADDLSEEHQLIEHLKTNHIKYAAADYWLAYRLTFVSREEVIVVPIDPLDDRYEQYRRQFLNEPKTALIFHPSWSRQSQQTFERSLQEQHITYRSQQLGKFTIVLTNRAL
jgi:hypothetical protein